MQLYHCKFGVPFGGGSRIILYSPSPFPSSLKHSNRKNKISNCSNSGKKMIVFLCKFYIQLLSSEQKEKKKKKEMHISWCKTVRCVTQCLATHLPHQELKVWRNPLRQAAWWCLTDGCLSSQVRSPLLQEGGCMAETVPPECCITHSLLAIPEPQGEQDKPQVRRGKRPASD